MSIKIDTKTLKSELMYAFYLILHPFDGYWDLKHEKRGSKTSATVILALLVIHFILKKQFTGFLYNMEYDGISLNVISEAAMVLVTFLLWCISNWSLTTLMDGEGTFTEVYIASAYATVPMILIGIPLTFASNYMALDMASFYVLFNSVSMVWMGGLMLAGTMVVHQYELGKTLLTAILIIVGMMVIIFLGLLFFNLISQLVNFFMGVYWELSLRVL